MWQVWSQSIAVLYPKYTSLAIGLISTAWKVSKYEVCPGPYFPAFWLSTERYRVSLCIQSECRKIWTRKNSVFGHFSPSAAILYIELQAIFLTLHFTHHFTFHILNGTRLSCFKNWALFYFFLIWFRVAFGVTVSKALCFWYSMNKF